jgi:uncharacterized protein YbaP (TraB family)
MRARTSLMLVAALATLAAVAFARGPAPVAAPPVAAALPKPASAGNLAPRPLLWRVSDADNSLYLVGSFHALKPDDYPVAASVDAAFADAELVAFEVSPEELASPELPLAFLHAAKFQNGGSLERALDRRTWLRLQTYADKRGMSVAALQAFEPWFVALTINMGEMGRMGYDPKQGLDQQFIARAAASGKRTLGLEAVATQIKVLDGMSAEEQRQSLLEALDDAEAYKQRMDELHAMWRRGDVAALSQLLTVEFRGKYPALYRRVNVERNQAWLPKLSALLDAGGADDTLVVVGTMHLLGPDGLVSQLRAKGYRVERL